MRQCPLYSLHSRARVPASSRASHLRIPPPDRPPKQSAHRRKGTRLPSAPKSDQICREFPPSMTGNSPPRGPVRLGDYHRSVPSTPTTPFVRLTVGTSEQRE